MGEEEKKVAEKAAEELLEKKEEKIVLRVLMHCEGCATKVRRCLKGFHGVEDVRVDRRTSEVVVKGEKADPLKVLERLQRKSHRKVELISPIPQTQTRETQTETEKEPAEKENEPEKDKQPADVDHDVDKESHQPAAVISMVLGVYMHCHTCAQQLKRRIQRMEGVESAEADVKSLEVNVKGVFEPQKLIDYVYKRTGKHAVTIKVEAEKAEQVEEEKKDNEEAENKEGGGGGASSSVGGGGEPVAEVDDEVANKVLELRKLEFHHHHNYPHNNNYYHMYPVQEMNNSYPPQIFSDDNPNACSIM